MKLTNLKPRIKTLSTTRTATVVASTSWRTSNQSSTARGYGYKWQQARAQHLSANPLCVYCMKERRPVAATVVDHIIPHKGDMSLFWDRSNWQSLCAPHHSRDKQREESQGRGGSKV